MRQGDLFGPGVLPWVTVADALGLHGHTHTQRTPETAKGGNLWQSTNEPNWTIPTHAINFRSLDGMCRKLTVAESALIQNFPNGHPWQGPKTAHCRQVGNAVPPKLAEVVGRALMAAEAAQ